MLPRFRSSWVPLTAIVALGGIVRGQHLGELSYNFDEAFCWKMIHFPPAEIGHRCAADNHPPLYFYSLWAWSQVFGDSPLALRSLSVVLGLATVVGAYLLVRKIAAHGAPQRAFPTETNRPHPGPLPKGEGDRPELSRAPLQGEGAALAAAALVALSPMQVDWSQYARMGYALGAALSVMSCWLLLRALERGRPLWTDLAWYVLAATALAYTHHFALFVLAGQFLYAVGWALRWTGEPAPTQPHPRAGTRAVPAATPARPSPDYSLAVLEGEGDAPRHSSVIPHRFGLLLAFALIAIAYLPWGPNLWRQCEQVSNVFHTQSFSWDEVAKACYQTLAVRWEDEPPSAAIAWTATAACLAPALAMLAWGRGGSRLIGLCILTTFDGAICASMADRNVIQSRYFVFANVLLLCGLPALVEQVAAACQGVGSPKRQRGTSPHDPRLRVGLPAGASPHDPRLRVGLPGGAATAAMVAGMAWLCLAHAERREGFASRPGMLAAMAYLAEARQPGEPVLVCNPLLQITAAACAGGWPFEAVQNVSCTGRARKPILSVQVLSKGAAFPHFQGTAVMCEEDYLSPEALAQADVRRVWTIDAVDWIAPEWKLHLPRQWVEVSDAKFREWAAAENCQIVVRCYEKRMAAPSNTLKVAEMSNEQ